MTLTQQIITVATGVAATMLTRFVPFILFRPGKPTPKYIVYLGKVLPPSVFALLVVYCLRNVATVNRELQSADWSLSLSPDAAAQIAGVAITLVVHAWRRNLMWSIAAGTVCYMLLTRI